MDSAYFVNREEELSCLLSHVPPKSNKSQAVALRSPSGFGKSGLMDRLCQELSNLKVNYVIVDPEIRTKSTTSGVYEGLFIQQCAIALEKIAQSKGAQTYTFRKFLKDNRKKLVIRKDKGDFFRKAPGFKSWYEILIDYIERYLLTGSYSTRSILSSQDEHSIEFSRLYISKFGLSKLVFIFREAQHFDQLSLRFILDTVRTNEELFVFFEYTSEDKNFRGDHHELINKQHSLGLKFYRYELSKLKLHHIAYLLRTYSQKDIKLSSDYYLNWDGNIRSIEELKFRVTCGIEYNLGENSIPLLTDAVDQYKQHISSLPSDQKMIIALISANVIPISTATLHGAFSKINVRTSYSNPSTDIDILLRNHGLITHTEESKLRIDNEDVSEAIETLSAMTSFLAYARKALKEYYLDCIEQSNMNIPIIESFTQSFILSSSTADASALMLLAKKLETLVGDTINPKIFADALYPAIQSKGIMFDDDRKFMAGWLIELLYDTGQYSKALQIFDQNLNQSNYFDLLKINCAIESGQHFKAKQTLNNLKSINGGDNNSFFLLMEALIARADNDREKTLDILRGLINSTSKKQSVHAYALRFMETVQEFPKVTRLLLESANIFNNLGFYSSEAYSRLASAMHLSRNGEITKAKTQVESAKNLLKSRVGDLHLLRNNEGATELYRLSPDLDYCKNIFEMARWTVEDDFSELVINTNLAITNSLLGFHDHANQLIKASMKIIEKPDFGDRDIFWSFAFNANFVFENSNQAYEGSSIMKDISSKNEPPIIYQDYWLYRFNLTEKEPNKKYVHMLNKKYHPLFLSHWQIDLEGIKSLSL